MHSRILTDNFDITTSMVKVFDHIVHVLTLFHKAKASLERYRRNDVECVPLKPFGQVNHLAFQVAHGVQENVVTLIHIYLIAL